MSEKDNNINTSKKPDYYDLILIRNDNGHFVGAVKTQMGLTGYIQALSIATDIVRCLDLTKHLDDDDIKKQASDVVAKINKDINSDHDVIAFITDDLKAQVADSRLVASIDLVNQILDLSNYVIVTDTPENPNAFNKWTSKQHFTGLPKVANLSLETNKNTPAWPDLVRVPLIRLSWIMSSNEEYGLAGLYSKLTKMDILTLTSVALLDGNYKKVTYLVNR